jgi:hypothetical protein
MKNLTEKEIFDAQMRIRMNSQAFAEKIQPIFEKNNWTWFEKNNRTWADWENPGKEKIPTVEEIIATIHVLANNLYSGRVWSVTSTGRIEVRCYRDYWREEQVNVSISLIPEWTSV